MQKYKIKDIININKHKYIIDKYDFWIKYLQQLSNDETNINKKTQYTDLIFSLETSKEHYLDTSLPLEALRMSYNYSKDTHFFDLSSCMDNIFDFFCKNTNFSKKFVKEKLDANLRHVSIVNSFPDSLTAGCYDSLLGTMSILSEEIQTKEFEVLLRHELTHILGNHNINGIGISGYARDYSKDSEYLLPSLIEKRPPNIINFFKKMIHRLSIHQTDNIQFNEACVDMFAQKDKQFQKKSLAKSLCLDYDIYTNVEASSLYVINSNFVRQMIIVNEIHENELFEGLFNYDISNNVINKFNKKTFKTISQNMDALEDTLNEYINICDTLFDKYYSTDNNSINKMNFDLSQNCTTEELDEKNRAKEKIEQTISSIERTIIDKILLKKLLEMDENKRKQVLREYSKFIISERDYFMQKTGFKYYGPSYSDEDGEKNFIASLKPQTDISYQIDKINDVNTINHSKEENRNL